MALTNATTLADYGAGIGTQGAALTVDATNKRVGVGTDAPAGPEGSLQVGTGITFFGNTGIISATGGIFSGDFSVAGALTFEDVTNIDSLGFGTFRSGLTVQGAGSTTTTLSVTGVSTFTGAINGNVTGNISGGTVAGSTGTFTGNVNTGPVLTVTGTEGISANLYLIADDGDDNGDGWRINSNQDDNDLTISNNTTGSYVDKFTLLKTGELTLTNDLIIPDKIIHTGDTNTAIRFPAADTFTVETAGVERTRVTSGGAIYINQQNQIGSTAKLEVTGTLDNTYPEYSYPIMVTDDAAYNSSGGPGGGIGFAFKQNSGGAYAQGGGIRGFKENTTDGNYASAMAFYTRANGAGVTERLRIASNGALLIGLTASVGEGGTPADLNSTEVGRGFINLSRDDTAAADHILFGKNGSIAASMGTDTTNTLVFKTGTTERLRITSAGVLQFASGGNLEMASNGRIFVGNGGNATNPMFANVSDTNTGIAFPAADTMMFATGGSERLRIDSRGSFLFSNGFLAETVRINTTARTGTQAVYLNAGNVHYFTSSATGTWKPNFALSTTPDINDTIATGDTFSVTMIVNKQNTAHYADSVQVDGSDVSIHWLGGAPTDGGPNNTFDVYSYTIIKTGDNTFKAFGSVSNYA